MIEKLSRLYFDKFLDIKGFYDKSAKFYDVAHHFQTLYADNVHRIAVAEAADFKDGNLVLDVGTGTSLAAICAINQAFPNKEIRVIGVDLSSKMLSKGRKNLDRFKIKRKIFQVNCDARFLPLRNGIFHKIISVYGIGGVRTGIKKLFLNLLQVAKKDVQFSLGEMTSPPKEKGLFKRKIHELLVEPFVNLVWQFKDLNLTDIFKMFHIKLLKRKYYGTHYLGSMSLFVGRLNNNVKNG